MCKPRHSTGSQPGASQTSLTLETLEPPSLNSTQSFLHGILRNPLPVLCSAMLFACIRYGFPESLFYPVSPYNCIPHVLSQTNPHLLLIRRAGAARCCSLHLRLAHQHKQHHRVFPEYACWPPLLPCTRGLTSLHMDHLRVSHIREHLCNTEALSHLWPPSTAEVQFLAQSACLPSISCLAEADHERGVC